MKSLPRRAFPTPDKLGWGTTRNLRPRKGTKAAQSDDAGPTAIRPPSHVSLKMNYPKDNLLLGTMANMQGQNDGLHKALDTQYPLELSIDCANLPLPRRALLTGTDLRPFGVIYFRPPKKTSWELMGRTETILHDEAVRFVTKLKLSCSTLVDRLKEIRVDIFHRRTASDDLREHKLIGTAECTLDDIVSEALLSKTIDLRNPTREKSFIWAHSLGQVTLSAEVLRPITNDLPITFDVEISSVAKGRKRLFYVLSRQIRSGEYTAVYRSEVLITGNRFMSLNRTLCAMTAGVKSKLLRLEMYMFEPKGKHVKLGFLQTSVGKLIAEDAAPRQLWWPAHIESADVPNVTRAMLTGKNVADDKLAFRFRFTN